MAQEAEVIQIEVSKSRYNAVVTGEMIKLEDVTYFVHDKLTAKALDQLFGDKTYYLILEPITLVEQAQRNRDILQAHENRKGYIKLMARYTN